MTHTEPITNLLTDRKRLKQEAKQVADMLGAGVLTRKEVVALLRRGAELAEVADAKDWTAQMRIFTAAAALQLKLLALTHAWQTSTDEETHVPLNESERRARLLELENSLGLDASTDRVGGSSGPDSLDFSAEE